MAYYTVFSDDGDCYYNDSNDKILLVIENAYGSNFESVYKDNDGNILLPDDNKTVICKVSELYNRTVKPWQPHNDSKCTKLPIMSFAEINAALAKEWTKYKPNIVYHFEKHALLINNDTVHIIGKEHFGDSKIIIGETVEEIRARNPAAIDYFLHILVSKVLAPED